MPKCLVTYYTDSKTNKLMWACPKGLTSTKHTATTTKCWRYDCPGARELPANSQCSHDGCSNSIRNVERAKYCSKQCKSRESSRRYRIRKKDEEKTINK